MSTPLENLVELLDRRINSGRYQFLNDLGTDLTGRRIRSRQVGATLDLLIELGVIWPGIIEAKLREEKHEGD